MPNMRRSLNRRPTQIQRCLSRLEGDELADRARGSVIKAQTHRAQPIGATRLLPNCAT